LLFWGFGKELRLNDQKGTIQRSVKMGYASENMVSTEVPICRVAIVENVVNRKLNDVPRRLPADSIAIFLVRSPSSWKNIDRNSILKITSIMKGMGRAILNVIRRQKELMSKKMPFSKRKITLSSFLLTLQTP
jgi:hypothetical protein